MKFRRGKLERQAGRAAGAAVAAAPLGKWSGPAGLVKRVRGALVRRQVIKAVASVPAGAALVLGLAVGIMLGAALMLSVIVDAAREGS